MAATCTRGFGALRILWQQEYAAIAKIHKCYLTQIILENGGVFLSTGQCTAQVVESQPTWSVN